jgi:hypothetical protein
MTVSALSFLSSLRWIDGRPLQLEPYRREIFRRALDDRRSDGSPAINLVLAGRAKKNWKSADLILAGLFCLECRESSQGSDVLLVANDEDQAGDDLDLAKKIVGINPDLAADLEILSKEIRRRDGKGVMRVLPGAKRNWPTRQDGPVHRVRRNSWRPGLELDGGAAAGSYAHRRAAVDHVI